MRWILAVIVLIAAGSGDPAVAHSRSESFSSWEIDGRTVRVTFTVQSREVTRIPWQEELAPDLALQLTRYPHRLTGKFAVPGRHIRGVDGYPGKLRNPSPAILFGVPASRRDRAELALACKGCGRCGSR